jgi:hypothetical protein
MPKKTPDYRQRKDSDQAIVTLMDAVNPMNWRKHPPEQLQSLQDLLQHPEVGWAGACLLNEPQSSGRSQVAIPVLVGNWSEEAERKILVILDPVACMANGDAAMYAKLVEQVVTMDVCSFQAARRWALPMLGSPANRHWGCPARSRQWSGSFHFDRKRWKCQDHRRWRHSNCAFQNSIQIPCPEVATTPLDKAIDPSKVVRVS